MKFSSSLLNSIFGFLLFVVGFLIIILFVSVGSQADNVNTSASVVNQAPSVANVTISTSSGGPALGDLTFTPREGVTTTLYVYGTYNDGNGCDEVTTGGEFGVALSRTGVATSSCSTSAQVDLRNCYVVFLNSTNTPFVGHGASCQTSLCQGGTDTSAEFSCTIPLQHFIDATDTGTFASEAWRSVVTITDSSNATSSLTGTPFEVATLNAIDSGSTVAFGTLDIGQTSADIPLNITNTGNKNGLDVQLSGTLMSCTNGTVAVGQQKYATGTSVTYLSKSSLTGSAAYAGMSIKKQISTSTSAVSTTYWMLKIPTFEESGIGLSGVCAGTITVIAA